MLKQRNQSSVDIHEAESKHRYAVAARMASLTYAQYDLFQKQSAAKENHQMAVRRLNIAKRNLDLSNRRLARAKSNFKLIGNDDLTAQQDLQSATQENIQRELELQRAANVVDNSIDEILGIKGRFEEIHLRISEISDDRRTRSLTDEICKYDKTNLSHVISRNVLKY